MVPRRRPVKDFFPFGYLRELNQKLFKKKSLEMIFHIMKCDSTRSRPRFRTVVLPYNHFNPGFVGYYVEKVFSKLTCIERCPFFEVYMPKNQDQLL